MRRVEQIMGTVFSFDVQAAADPTPVLDDVVAWLREVDDTFSPFRATSAVSRLGRREVTLAGCGADVAEVLDRCHELSSASHGYFSLTPNGSLDPCGFVKGWAVERASAQLLAAGFADHAVSGGGDVRVCGESGGRPWRVGVVDPDQPLRVSAVVASRQLAIATSGTAERGAHVIDPMTGCPATELASLTVIGPDLGLADGYATAGVAMGSSAREWLDGLPGYEAFGITAARRCWRTAGFDRLAAG
jgi:thiamine biosynthesis lipoprotein